jgi:hypothetical protein
LDPADGYLLAHALKQNRSLQRVSVAGNYRMALAIPELVQVSVSRLVELDCSFCDVQNKFQKQVFELLALTPQCTIRSLRMQGTRINDTEALVQCIRHNRSLEQVILDQPREPFPIEADGLREMLEALQHNYLLRVLRVDYKVPDQTIILDMQFWLQLNQCGRSILLQDNHGSQCRPKSWLTVLRRAALLEDVDIMFWVLKHGAGHF